MALYTPQDAHAPFTGEATEARLIDKAPNSYLDVEAVIRAAKDAGADALHPGNLQPLGGLCELTAVFLRVWIPFRVPGLCCTV